MMVTVLHLNLHSGFLKEQVTEEEKFRNLLFKMNLDAPKWKIDELFKDLEQ